jgi:hypothetical protein
VVGDALRVRVLAAADGVEQVALRDDPRARSVRVHHDRRADAPAGHGLGGLAQRVARTDRQNDLAHPIANMHDRCVAS